MVSRTTRKHTHNTNYTHTTAHTHTTQTTHTQPHTSRNKVDICGQYQAIILGPQMVVYNEYYVQPFDKNETEINKK